jgi:hypothetical protein
VRKDADERSGDSVEVETVDEEARVAELASAGASHEAPKLAFGRSPTPCGLSLKRSKGVEIAFGLDDPLDGVGPERADELVLQVGAANEEAERLQVGRFEVGAEARFLETALEHRLLASVAEPGEPCVRTMRAEPGQKASNRLGAADRNDGDAFLIEVVSAPRGERLDRDLVAEALDEHDRPRCARASEGACRRFRAARRKRRDALAIAQAARTLHTDIVRVPAAPKGTGAPPARPF